MPFCPTCGAEVDETAKFCTQCGSRLHNLKSTARDSTPTFTPIVREFVPEEVKGWSWGAFFFTWLWGACNRVWISLLALIPYVGFVMAFVLGVKGKEWAWQKGQWESVEHFQRTQHKWSVWGWILFLLGGLLFILMMLFLAATGVEP